MQTSRSTPLPSRRPICRDFRFPSAYQEKHCPRTFGRRSDRTALRSLSNRQRRSSWVGVLAGTFELVQVASQGVYCILRNVFSDVHSKIGLLQCLTHSHLHALRILGCAIKLKRAKNAVTVPDANDLPKLVMLALNAAMNSDNVFATGVDMSRCRYPLRDVTNVDTFVDQRILQITTRQFRATVPWRKIISISPSSSNPISFQVAPACFMAIFLSRSARSSRICCVTRIPLRCVSLVTSRRGL